MSSYIRQAVARVRRAVVRTIVVTAAGGTALELTTHLPTQGRSSEFYHHLVDQQITPLMRRWLDPESEL